MVFIITKEDIQLEQLQSPQITINILFPKSNNVSRKHGCGWEGAAPKSDVAQCGYPRVGAASKLFFFFIGFMPTQLQFALNRADLARIGPYRPYQVISAGN